MARVVLEPDYFIRRHREAQLTKRPPVEMAAAADLNRLNCTHASRGLDDSLQGCPAQRRAKGKVVGREKACHGARTLLPQQHSQQRFFHFAGVCRPRRADGDLQV